MSQEPTIVNSDQDKFSFTLSKKDLDILFKFLSRADLKGMEVPEFNKILEIFNPKNIKMQNKAH